MGARLKQRLAEGKLVRVFGVGQLCSPKLVEMIGMLGEYDAVWLDQEHVGLTITQMEEAGRAARAVGLDSFARLYATDYASLMRPLEAGVGGVMAAQVRSVQDAQFVVQWAKFHPLGQRGVNGTGVDGRYGTLRLDEYFRLANETSFVAIQIENREALDDVERIAAVAGIDVLFIGPADLSQSLGIPGQWEHPRLWEAIERIAAACRQNHIHWAILPLSPAHAERCVGLGCRMLSIGMDSWVVQRGLREFLGDYKGIGLKS